MIYARLQSVLIWECRPNQCQRLVSRRLLVLIVLYEGQHLTHIFMVYWLQTFAAMIDYSIFDVVFSTMSSLHRNPRPPYKPTHRFLLIF